MSISDIPAFKTVDEEFKIFVNQCYPGGMTEDQGKQIRQAFCAGSLTMAFRAVTTILKEEDNAKLSHALADMVKDANDSCAKIVAELHARQGRN